MSAEHGGHTHGPEHHGGARGLGWEVLDSIMAACFAVVLYLLAEQLWRAYKHRAEVRYDLTPEGRAAAEAQKGPLVDVDKLREAVERGDLGTDKTTE
jgi:galactose mutarotase-like enzyme